MSRCASSKKDPHISRHRFRLQMDTALSRYVKYDNEKIRRPVFASSNLLNEAFQIKL